ncbi:MAG: alternative ribosome rescue aminoacyl-tRNA hydrolase ArfB [Victivallaceae bacterium]
MLRISEKIVIPDDELKEEFFQSSGPGGQNVNKVATAVRLRFNVQQTRSLPEGVRLRLLSKVGPRLTNEGERNIEAQRYRTQQQNREDAAERLANLIRGVLVPPKTRRPTRPTKASVKRRIDSKKKHGTIKKSRTTTAFDD